MSDNNVEARETTSNVNVTFTVDTDGNGRYCYSDGNPGCESEAELIYDRSFGG